MNDEQQRDMERMWKFAGNVRDWEVEWLSGRTEWWPDSLRLKGAFMVGREGCPSSPMPPLAQQRVEAFREAGEEYVFPVATGVHAYRIGFAYEYSVCGGRYHITPGMCDIIRRRRAAEARIRRAEIVALESAIGDLAVETRAALNMYERKQRELTKMRKRLRNLKARKDTKEIPQ